MIISLFDSITRAYVSKQAELDWTDLVSVLTYHNDVPSKESVMLYNLAKYRSLDDPLVDWGRYYIYVNGQPTGRYNKIPNTIRRCKENLLEIWGIVLDVDKKKTIAQVQDELIDLEYVLYTTFRHTHEAHRFRVVIPFSRPLDPESMQLRISDIKSVFPDVDQSSFSQAQSFYFHSGPVPYSYHNRGQIIDPFQFREQEPIVRLQYTPAETSDVWVVDQLLQRIAAQWPNLDGHYNEWRQIAWATCHAVGLWEAQQLLMKYWPRKTKKEMTTLNKWDSKNSPTIGTLIKQSGISKTERDLIELQSKIRRKS